MRIVLPIFLLPAVCLSTSVFAATCESLIGTTLPDATIVSATTLSGTVRDPNGKVIARGVAEFCAVNIVATPSSDSLINIALWLPTNWNGRFEGTGNGGYAGNMEQDYEPMVFAVNHGMAVAATDMGTAPAAIVNADVLIGHPQKWIDWGHRATHVMTQLSKQVITTYYGSGPRYSYFNGCSTGGQQGLMSAQRYPADYDGILAGAPAHDRTHVHTNVMWMFAQAHKKPNSSIGAVTADTITKNIVAACAAKSGGAPGDNFLTDPRLCDWRPSDMRCTATGQSGCLNDDQVRAATAIYAGPVDPATGKQIYPGSVKGSENALLVRVVLHADGRRADLRFNLQVGVRSASGITRHSIITATWRRWIPCSPRFSTPRTPICANSATATARSSCSTDLPIRWSHREARSITTKRW